ncbi:WecB/TagA/CpsF family glycosyltransferase [Salinimicrobium sp. HB62]|uniref:WecB/TagA/CpsF family glycosyltransferase n=1 Tax=Salinimicrobium sp. HB62 TaxID=3077781 RepID=UPI002D7A316D|nr:WecB/TagA/CpsF family glycosyltransferase [Salinimicrobium sp. HB62]
MSFKPVRVNNTKIYPFKNFDQLLQFCENEKKILIAINARKIINEDPNLKDLIHHNIGYVDGVGAKIAIRKKTGLTVAKIPGCELWLEIIKKFQKTKSFYFIGSKDRVIEATVKKLKQDFPNIKIKGYRNGYIKSEEERNALYRDLKKKKPSIIFVAMGSPRQEYFMRDCLAVHPALYQGLGGSFDVYLGNKKRPPKLLIDFGLEGAALAVTEGLKSPWQRTKRSFTVLKMFFMLYTNKI